jgi:hypothetical protein
VSMPRAKPIHVAIPIETEVLRLNRELFTGTRVDKDKGVIISLDARRKKWSQIIGIPSGSRVHWSRVHIVEIQELSSFLCPIRYEVTIGEPWWRDRDGTRHDFGIDEHLKGLDLKRRVTTVTLRAAVLMAVLACVGLRSVAWLMRELFYVEVCKSSLSRWIAEAAGHLPDAEGMVRRMAADKPITEAHLDEIFPRGWRRGCVMVVKDEHGRIVATQEVEERTKANVKAFLEQLKGWGLDFRAFYIDGCKAYRQAIPEVYPEAAIQYDYFHVIQNIFRHLWRAMVRHRKDIKQQSKEAAEPEERTRLKKLAERLWKHRGLMFKNEERMSEEERQELRESMAADVEVSVLRGFLCKLRGIFRDSKGERGAKQRLGKLKRRDEVKPGSGYEKAVKFLEERFEDMTTFLRSENVRRNSLAESGIRCLRRLEQGHDGFRGSAGRDNYLRLYQAIRYCGWSVHRGDGLLCLPPLPSSGAAS